MSNSRGRTTASLALIFGAVVFGMVLAGGTNLTPLSVAAPEASPDGAVRVPVPVGGLPGFADLADAVAPAVASIEVHTYERRRRGGRQDLFDLFRRQQRPVPPLEPDEDAPQQRRDSSGSGFVISPDGLIVTNYHVVDGATELSVTIDGEVYEAEVRGSDPATDLALLEIEADKELPYLALGDAEALRVGEWIMVIGSPLRLENSVSVGVVSAKGRNINITPDASLENFIQTDAAINFGNSGGPLVNLRGEVVGIATAINQGAENIGFAVPVTTLQRILPQLRDTGVVRRGYLGVNIRDIDERYARAFGLAEVAGILAQEVVPDGPSDKAGLENGDVILRIDGKEINQTRKLIEHVSGKPPGASVKLDIIREGKAMTKTVKLGERNIANAAAPVEPEESSPEREIEWLGIQYQDLSRGVRENHNLPDDIDGVWIGDVDATSPLYDENVIPGDIIVSVQGENVESAAAFERMIGDADSGDLLRLYVRRFDPRTGQQVVAFYALVEVP